MHVFTRRLLFVGLTVLCTETVSLNAAEKEMHEAIYESAWYHMEPELAACEDLECIENLLRFKEKQLALLTLFESGISVEKGMEIMQAYPLLRDLHKQFIDNSPAQEHETKHLKLETVLMTRQFLTKSSINSRKIKIASKRHLGDDKTLALATNANATNAATITYLSKRKDTPSAYVIAHEITHIDEAHGLKKGFIVSHAQVPEVDIFQTKQLDARYCFSKMGRMFEMQADLLPLLRFKEHVIGEELLKKQMPECIYWYQKGELNTLWHKPSNMVSTHAGCTEELPFILKINDLRQRGAVPLYEKATRKKSTNE